MIFGFLMKKSQALGSWPLAINQISKSHTSKNNAKG